MTTSKKINLSMEGTTETIKIHITKSFYLRNLQELTIIAWSMNKECRLDVYWAMSLHMWHNDWIVPPSQFLTSVSLSSNVRITWKWKLNANASQKQPLRNFRNKLKVEKCIIHASSWLDGGHILESRKMHWFYHLSILHHPRFMPHPLSIIHSPQSIIYPPLSIIHIPSITHSPSSTLHHPVSGYPMTKPNWEESNET